MAIDIEKMIKDIMREAAADGEPVTEEEAREMAEMEIKSNGIRRYEHSETAKPKPKREPKIDTDKVELIQRIRNCLNIYTTNEGGIENLNIANPQKEITFNFNGAEYSISLIKHRPKKEN